MSTSARQWKDFIDSRGDFELPTYLFRTINELMKITLDYGTMISGDKNKLRSYRERVKREFKDKWLDVAAALEYFDIITPCGCGEEYCDVCGGSRYTLNAALSPDEMREISMVVADENSQEIANRLHNALQDILDDIEDRDFRNYNAV